MAKTIQISMDNKENIIQIKDRLGNDMAKLAFADFMAKTESRFNELSKNNPMLFKKCSPSQLEEQTESVLKEIAPSTPFRPEEIKLVSGHSFPDVIAEKFFGVEVKSTKENHWTSTGSSIVENTRNDLVENIYMLFGKLGGTPPEFKCRPYEDCLYQIAVTHSPRYLIDMELREKNQQTIFDKLQTSYDAFRKDSQKIDRIREYYIREAVKSGKEEMPWWVGRQSLNDQDDMTTPPITLFSNSPMKDEIKAEIFLLFPEVINGKYANAALWLCTHKYMLCPNMRDEFSASGKVRSVNGKPLSIELPHVFQTIVELMPIISRLLKSNEYLDLYEYHPEYRMMEDVYSFWVTNTEKMLLNRIKVTDASKLPQDIRIREWLEKPDKYVLK